VRRQQAAGVSGAQMYILQALSDGRPRSLNELAATTFTDRTSVAEVVARLQDRKLVKRQTAPSDRRRAEITLTPAGRVLLVRAPRNIAPLLTSLQSLPPAELTQLARSLARLTRSLNADVGPAPFAFEEETRPASGARRSTRT